MVRIRNVGEIKWSRFHNLPSGLSDNVCYFEINLDHALLKGGTESGDSFDQLCKCVTEIDPDLIDMLTATTLGFAESAAIAYPNSIDVDNPICTSAVQEVSALCVPHLRKMHSMVEQDVQDYDKKHRDSPEADNTMAAVTDYVECTSENIVTSLTQAWKTNNCAMFARLPEEVEACDWTTNKTSLDTRHAEMGSVDELIRFVFCIALPGQLIRAMLSTGYPILISTIPQEWNADSTFDRHRTLILTVDPKSGVRDTDRFLHSFARKLSKRDTI